MHTRAAASGNPGASRNPGTAGNGVKVRLAPPASLLFADSEKDANILYATRVFVPDPFVFIRHRGRKYIFVNDMEHSRVAREAQVDRVYTYGQVKRLFGNSGNLQAQIPDVCALFFKAKKVKCLEVPRNFPSGFADDLRGKGFLVTSRADPYFPLRARKTGIEVGMIRRSLLAAEAGLGVAREALREARIDRKRKNLLLLGGEPLTSERMRVLIHQAVLERSCQAARTIVCCGKAGCEPHARGDGPLYANEPIIVDVFPRSEITGYFGDMTRTFVKGRASERLLAMHAAVDRAQNLAIAMIKPGAAANKIHKAVVDSFRQQGFPRETEHGRMSGFIHGTGHGLGLEIHEHPVIGERSCRLAEGNVVTVEPGLYYPEIGGLRIEDVVWVTARGARKLTRFPRLLEVDS